jgi:hypothetical protein
MDYRRQGDQSLPSPTGVSYDCESRSLPSPTGISFRRGFVGTLVGNPVGNGGDRNTPPRFPRQSIQFSQPPRFA